MSIYVLTALTVLSDDNGGYRLTENGNIRILRDRIGVFSSVEKAETAMDEVIKNDAELGAKWGYMNGYFGFLLDELYLDDALYGDGNHSSFESRRSYLPDGRLNYFSDLDDRCAKKFDGTDSARMHIKEGDYALYVAENSAIPILVDRLPFTKEQWSKNFQKGVYGDFTDDSGLAFSKNGGHDHPWQVDVFPMTCLPGFKLDEESVRLIGAARKKYYGNS